MSLLQTDLPNRRPAGVAAIAVLFFLTAIYLLVIGNVMLIAPGTLSMVLGAPIIAGRALAGPYMFLLFAAVSTVVGIGLCRMNNWARRAALLAGMIGIAMLLPTVSSSVIEFRPGNLAWGGLGIIVRMMVVWYLWQTPVAERFAKKTLQKHGGTQ
ncbi:MAG: hypothetical protein M3O09_16490 [Acidobacteriota bacterium]|nr:hypothetical protein [Acidobacteriota bacterium]